MPGSSGIGSPLRTGIFWPCPTPDHPGTPRLFLDRFATEDGRARFHPVEYRGAAEQPDETYPLTLTTGRVMAQYQSGTQTRRVASLVEAEPDAFVEIHVETARGLGIAQGEIVRLTTRRGQADLKARLSRAIRLDTLFVPFHWGGHRPRPTCSPTRRSTRCPAFPSSRSARFAPSH